MQSKTLWLVTLSLTLALGACSKKSVEVDPVAPPGVFVAPVDKGWEFETTPSFVDDFTVDGLPDAGKWSYDIGGSGWGNNELQYYTDAKNASTKNGILSIETKKEAMGGRLYTSARMVTKGKADFLYGRFEIRAKLPTGKGLWPAIWMLSTDNTYGNWPKSGEIDIMEQVGFAPTDIHITVHTGLYNHLNGTQKGITTQVPTAVSEYHNYRVDWTPYAVRGYVDGVLKFEFINEGKGSDYWPFDKKFHLLLNLAVGGNWAGQQGIDDTAFPAKMEVDYVKVYPMIPK